MAKQKDVNKSAEVHALLAKDPKAKVSAIVSALAARGIKVSTAYVYTLKSLSKRKARKAKHAKVMAASSNGGGISMELLMEVKELAVKAGGIGWLKEVVDVLAG